MIDRRGVFLSLLGFAVSLAVIILWVIFKCNLIDKLEYTSDLFNFVTSSRSIFEGRPIFWENSRGAGSWLHNNFIIFLAYPFTADFGAYGLVAFTGVIYALSVAFLWHQVIKQKLPGSSVVMVLVLAFGPVGLWLFDDPIYGWHPELLYPPLALGFAAALLAQSAWRYVFMVLMLLVRQDGAVLCCCIELGYLWFRTKAVQLRLSECLWIVGRYLIIFSLGMLILNIFAPAGDIRVSQALQNIQLILTNDGSRAEVREIFWRLSVLSSALLLCILQWVGVRDLLAILMLSIPILVVGIIAALAHFPLPLSTFGLMWPPRYALLFAFALSVLLFLLSRPQGWDYFASRRVMLTLLLLGTSIYLQFRLLQDFCGYDYFGRIYQAFSTKAITQISQLKRGEIKLARCLAEQSPRRTSVAISAGLVGFFHKLDTIMLSSMVEKQVTKPHFYLCDSARRLPFDYDCLGVLMSAVERDSEIKSLRFNQIQIGYIPELETAVGRCLDWANRAPKRTIH